jgi:Cd2+/Zn2+-exporting ATPase
MGHTSCCGCNHNETDKKTDKEPEKNGRLSWLIGSLILVGIFEFLSLSGFGLPRTIALPFFVSIIILIGHHTLLDGFKALLKLQFKSINTLMFLAVLGAIYLEKYEEAAIVIVLYNLAEKLEESGIEQSKKALTELSEMMPKTASLKNQDNVIPVDQVKVGDIITIKPGDMISLDGIIVFGDSSVDESPITGEPIAKDKMKGDFVFAGTLNKQGYIEVEVSKRSHDTTLAKIEEITFQAIQSKAETQKFIEVFSSYYTPSIIILAITCMVLAPYVLAIPFEQSFLNALTLLVIACPCALVISTPVSIYSAIGNAAKKGILVKGGRYLEAFGKIKAFALDKTRTLTYGKPVVTDIIAFNKNTKEHLLSCAAGMESYSEHPLAKSITEAAEQEKYTPHKIENFRIHVGKGIQADCLVCDDKHHCIGKLQFILEEHEVPEDVIKQIDALQKEGKTVIVVATHKEIEGLIALVDEIRDDSYAFIDELKKLHITPVMLTGDNKASAEAVAKAIGITQVHANLLPEEKAHMIKQLLKQYRTVAMLGDGINDAPSLALATVGVTMSKLGSDTAIEAASIVILNDKLSLIPFLIKLARRTVGTIQVNISASILVKAAFITLALVGKSNLALAIFADVGVTLLVVLNSLRLSK